MASDNNTATEFGVAPPDPELKRLEPLIGTWHAEEKTEAGVLGPGVPVRNDESCEWLEGGYFLVQTYEAVFGEDPPQKGINYWFYDSEARKFRIIFFSNNGNFTEDGNRYGGEVADGKLTFEGPARFQYDLDEEGKIKVNPDGSIEVAWWLRDASGEWSPWMVNKFS